MDIVKTNNVPRNVIDGYELTAAEQTEFDYLDWSSLGGPDNAWIGHRGETTKPSRTGDDATFFRYRGQLFDIGEFMQSTDPELTRAGWQGIATDTFFSATVIRFVDDNERVIVGRIYS